MPSTNIRNIKRSVDFSKDDGNIKFGYAEFEISVKHLSEIEAKLSEYIKLGV